MLDELGIDVDYKHAGAGYRIPRHLDELDTSLAANYARIVVFLRDPRDTVVSGYYHCTRRLRSYSGSISEFIRDPRLGVAKVARFHHIWRSLACERNDIAVLTYEALQENTAGAVSQVAAYFGFSPGDDQVLNVVRNNTFEVMQARERAGKYAVRYGRPLIPADPSDPYSFKVRRGLIGGFVDELSPDDIAYCDNVLRQGR